MNGQAESQGKNLELVSDAEDRRLVYAVLSVGGLDGLGNKLFAMPWKAAEFHATEHMLIFNVRRKNEAF